ncbi:uncharacterized protein LOC126826821 [Patella vulgata]|uniref:uncharacterized protein LOC126826821 n=1 Tax=Patella vulgata TaxID=6465 RepID=UPI0024A844D4|nr:uncharacterized protein LOC126826821 [Patella vulgata]
MNTGGPESSYGELMGRNKIICDISREQILEIVDTLISDPSSENEPFTVAEYGAADSSSSMGLMTDIINTVRSKCGINKEIHIMYEDLPLSDFNSLYKRIHGIIPIPRSYLLDHENVYVTSSGTNFYKQCFPANSVDLAISFSSLHWLSKSVQLSDSVYRNFSKCEEEKDAIKELAYYDWMSFLKNRTKELKPGGWGIFSTFGEDEATLEKPTKMAFQDVYTQIDKLWKSFYSRGIITQAEFVRGTFAVVFRNTRELEEPFRASNELQNLGLKLHKVKLDISPCYFKTEWKERLELGVDDREKFAQDLANLYRVPTYNTFYGALDGERSEEDKSQICELLYEELRDAFLTRYPEEVENDGIIINTYVFKQ